MEILLRMEVSLSSMNILWWSGPEKMLNSSMIRSRLERLRICCDMVLILESISAETMERTYSSGTFCGWIRINVLAL